MPRDIQEVLSRHKDIVYSSRTRHNTDVYKKMNNLKTDLYKALMKIPQDQLSEQERELRDSLMHLPEITILQMIYQQRTYEGDLKDHEFSATSMREHWQSGLDDTRRTLEARRPGWRCRKPAWGSSCTMCTANGIIETLLSERCGIGTSPSHRD